MKMFIFTFGCKVNQYDGQILREGFEGENCKIVDRLSDSSVVLINSCAVTSRAERDVYKLSKRALKEGKRVIITGCFTDELRRKIINLSPEVKFCNDKDKLLKKPPSGITYFYKHTRAFIKIQDGCDAFCSYCIVPFLRNKIFSRKPDDILSEIKGFVAKGCPEVVICGIRLGKYNYAGVDLSSLIEMILSLNGDFKIKLSSIELNDISDQLIQLIKKSPRIIKHLHIPLQSGSTRILHLMNRKYTPEEFYSRIISIKREIPEMIFTTDVMVGFPSEEESDFFDTLKLVKEIGFKKVHVFPFSPRPYTKASQIKPFVQPNEIKRRSKILLSLYQ